jgi:formate dehydrogenase subunit beta
MKGDMYIAHSADQKVIEQAECGGVVTSLLKFALDNGKVDGALIVRARNGDRYDGIPALVTDAQDIIGTGGSLHCASPNIARFLKEYLNGASDQKIAVVVKPCDAKAIIELVKRYQINLDNLLLIGLNCTGTLPAAKSKKMFRDEFEVDPADIIAEDIEDNKLIIRLKDGTEKEKDLAELEQKGYGRRENCRRCDINIPIMADIACGKWGTKDKNTTFVEVYSDKGSEFIEAAIKDGCIKADTPTTESVDTRKKKDAAAVELAKQQQEKDFASLNDMSPEEKASYWFGQFNHCIKCYGCRDACPICYCDECFLEAGRGLVPSGEVPPDILFPMVRAAHVMDSCVNCGQCQDVCTMELPIARLIFMLSKELSDIFNYEAGIDVSQLPPLRTVDDEELSNKGVEVVV